MALEKKCLLNGTVEFLEVHGNELKTVGPATENARRANSVRTLGGNRRGCKVSYDTVRIQ